MLVFWLLVSCTEPDGSTVSGFRPGYAPTTVSEDRMGDYTRLRFPGGQEFCFDCRFPWDSAARCLVDLIDVDFTLFSIEPVTTDA